MNRFRNYSLLQLPTANGQNYFQYKYQYCLRLQIQVSSKYQEGFSWSIFKQYCEKRDLENLLNYSIGVKITSNIERAFRWFSLAIVDTDYPSKIIKLCSALESILTNRNEKKKAEPLVFRMAYINYFFDNQFPSPKKIMAIYNLRSEAVHGSKIDKSNVKKPNKLFKEFHHEYIQLQSQTRRTLINYIAFSNEYQLTNKNMLFKKIDINSKDSGFKDNFKKTYPDINLNI